MNLLSKNIKSEYTRWYSLAAICIAVALSLTTWFSATALTPEFTRLWSLSDAGAAWLTNGVQIGFVTGAILASFVNLPDIVPLHRLMAASAVVACFANAVLLLPVGPEIGISARIATGVALAGVYPPSLKLISTWFKSQRGFALGAVIGALTLGSAVPHLAQGVAGGANRHMVIVVASIAALVGGGMFAKLASEGPYPFPRAIFSPRQIGAVLRNRPLMLANVGYFGHMWELYAFWGWFLAYATAALRTQGVVSSTIPSFLTFGVIAVGVVGCFLGGGLSDRFGRTFTTILMMTASGGCALAIGFAFEGPTWIFVSIAAVWGISVIGDSAQFSAIVTEIADNRLIGTSLTLQMGIGFALTIISVWITPVVATLLGGWRWTFVILAPGPLIGILAMIALRHNYPLR